MVMMRDQHTKGLSAYNRVLLRLAMRCLNRIALNDRHYFVQELSEEYICLYGE